MAAIGKHPADQGQAFPVLCRILTELKLLQTPVGVIVLSAGVGNDVVGWILLALCVALVNSGTGLTALYVLLTAFGYCLLLAYAIRPGFLWILQRSGSLQDGPSQSIVALTLLLVLASSFFTAAIGIHAIFGAFMIGLICPHEGGFAVKIVEKLEDLISVLLLPLYFALSGLSTNIGLLDNGITWAYVIGVVTVAFCAKVAGGLLAARANGLLWRESATIGVLMSCKGLVELIVLNIGLQARILSTRTFTIFVVMALITTFATTPLTSWLYPESYQKKLDLWKRGKIDWDGNPIMTDDDQDKDTEAVDLGGQAAIRRMLVYLRLDGLPSLFTFINLVRDQSDAPKQEQKKHHLLVDKEDEDKVKKASAYTHHLRRPLEVHGLRLMELTERDSSVMKVSEVDEYGLRDPVVKAFRTFGRFNDIAVAGHVAVVPERSYADIVIERAEHLSSDFVLLPWSETGSTSEQPSFQALSKPQTIGPYLNFLHDIFERSCLNTNIGVFIDRLEPPANEERINRTLTRTTTGGISIYSGHGRSVPFPHHPPLAYHILVPYFGTLDDRFCVRLALQLAQNDFITATIIRLTGPATAASHQSPGTAEAVLSPGTIGSASVAATDETSSTNQLDEKDVVAVDEGAAFFTSTRDNLPTAMSGRVVFQSPRLNLMGTFTGIVELLNQSINTTTNDAGIEHIVICSRSISKVWTNATLPGLNGGNVIGSGNGASPMFPSTPRPAGTLLSPVANALGMQTPLGPGTGTADEGRVLGGLGTALWEASRNGGLRASIVVVQAKKEKDNRNGSRVDVTSGGAGGAVNVSEA